MRWHVHHCYRQSRLLLWCFQVFSAARTIACYLSYPTFQQNFYISQHRRPRPPNLSKMSTDHDPLGEIGLPRPLILGSASFTRKLILKEMNVDFTVVVRPIDEKSLGDREKDEPSQLVLHLAMAKMQHLVDELQSGHCEHELPVPYQSQSWVVLTGDQVVTCNGQILEKPESIQQAKDFVAQYRTHPPSTVGSCVLTHLPSGIQVSGVDTATVHFATNTAPDLVDRLLQEDAPILSCAGGLMVEHPLVKEYIIRIDGTEDSVMGLSKDLVRRLLMDLRTQLKEKGIS